MTRDKKRYDHLLNPVEWQVIEVTEGKKTWYEVHARDSSLVVTDGYITKRFRSRKVALRTRDYQNKKELERYNRKERVIET